MRALGVGLAIAAALAGTAAATPASDLYEAACAGELRTERVGRVSAPALDELSGVAASRRRPGVLWVANDSGAEARVYAIATGGRLLQTVAVSAAAAVDWEDLALGPGPERGASYLYAADIGDNDTRRATVDVYRFREPGAGAREAVATRLGLRYPDGPHNAEALLVDPATGRLVVVTKRLGTAAVYAAPRRLAAGGVVTLRRVGSVSALLGPVTGGAVSAGGDVVALRTVLGVALWRRSAGTAVWAAFGSRVCTGAVRGESQGEAVTFGTAGGGLVTIAEGARPAVNRIVPASNLYRGWSRSCHLARHRSY